MELKQATAKDLPCIMEFIEAAKSHLQATNVRQWQDGYPDEARILQDILQNEGYLLMDQEEPLAYLVISLKEDPFYKDIRGKWISEQPYGVIHRLAISPKLHGKHLAEKAIQQAEDHCRFYGIHSMRIDTNDDNKAMQYILKKIGYCHCGMILFDGEEKIAFQKNF